MKIAQASFSANAPYLCILSFYAVDILPVVVASACQGVCGLPCALAHSHRFWLRMFFSPSLIILSLHLLSSTRGFASRLSFQESVHQCPGCQLRSFLRKYEFVFSRLGATAVSRLLVIFGQTEVAWVRLYTVVSGVEAVAQLVADRGGNRRSGPGHQPPDTSPYTPLGSREARGERWRCVTSLKKPPSRHQNLDFRGSLQPSLGHKKEINQAGCHFSNDNSRAKPIL